MLVRLVDLPPGLERQPLEVLPLGSRLALPLIVFERACLGFGASQRLPQSWRPSLLLPVVSGHSSASLSFARAFPVAARLIRSCWLVASLAAPRDTPGPHGALGWLVVSRCGLEACGKRAMPRQEPGGLMADPQAPGVASGGLGTGDQRSSALGLRCPRSRDDRLSAGETPPLPMRS